MNGRGIGSTDVSSLVEHLREMLGTGDLTCELCDRGLAFPLTGQWPQRFGSAAFAGEVRTVLSPEGELAPIDRMLALLEPGQVLLVVSGSEAAVWGSRLTARAKDRGAAGVVVDGHVRDVAELRAAGMAVAARGIAPHRSDAAGSGSMDCEVTVGRQAVRSGDVLVADENGLVVIPARSSAEVLAKLA